MPRNRHAVLDEIQSGTLDVFVMGGGINGAGVLRDLALRAEAAGVQLRTALVEKGHFSSGTSGRNSQLIHGGLRYLKNFEFKLVSEALAERAVLLRTAPHLVEPLAFLIPLRDPFSAAFYETGLYLYDFLAGANRIARHRHLSASALNQREPRMRRFSSGSRFFDCRVHSARLVLLNLRDAAIRGALPANYVSAASYAKTADGTWRVELVDQLSGLQRTARARVLVNATGAWSREGNLRLVRGSHLVLPRLGTSEDAVSYFGRDGRIIFFIPWGRRHAFTLVGTTDVDHTEGADQTRISRAEVRYLLDAVEEVFPDTGPHEPVAAYSSLRPLVRDEASSATKTSREHRIWADEQGLVHISGGKYTTYRRMSEEAVDLLTEERWPRLSQSHQTAEVAIGGNTLEALHAIEARAQELAGRYELPETDVREVIKDYGVDAPRLLEGLSETKDAVSPLEAAQIGFAVREEWVERLTDLMYVSTYWGYERRWNTDLLQPFARELGKHLAWNDSQQKAEVERMLAMSNHPLS